MDFVKKRIGKSNSNSASNENENKKSINYKSKLLIQLQFADNSIRSTGNQYVNGLVSDINLKDKIENARIKGTVFYNSQPLERFIDQTDLSGEFSYRIKSNLEPGEYNLVVNVSKDNYGEEDYISRFNVQ